MQADEPMKIFAGEIEGRILGELNGEWAINVGGNKDDVEYLHDWIIKNAPKGSYVIITVALLEGV